MGSLTPFAEMTYSILPSGMPAGEALWNGMKSVVYFSPPSVLCKSQALKGVFAILGGGRTTRALPPGPVRTRGREVGRKGPGLRW